MTTKTKITMLHITHEQGEVQFATVQIDNHFEAWQKAVGGYVTTLMVHIDHELTCHILMDEDAMLKKSTPTLFIANQMLLGNLLVAKSVAKSDVEGEIASLSSKEAEKLLTILKSLVTSNKSLF